MPIKEAKGFADEVMVELFRCIAVSATLPNNTVEEAVAEDAFVEVWIEDVLVEEEAMTARFLMTPRFVSKRVMSSPRFP